MNDDYYYSQEARDSVLMLVWKCSDCGEERMEYPGTNEGGTCNCGGELEFSGESYI